jgi:hypothetical protein
MTAHETDDETRWGEGDDAPADAPLESARDVQDARAVILEFLDAVKATIPRLRGASPHRDAAGAHVVECERYLERASLGYAAARLAWAWASVDAAAPGGKVKLAAALEQRWNELRAALPPSIATQLPERRNGVTITKAGKVRPRRTA